VLKIKGIIQNPVEAWWINFMNELLESKLLSPKVVFNEISVPIVKLEILNNIILIITVPETEGMADLYYPLFVLSMEDGGELKSVEILGNFPLMRKGEDAPADFMLDTRRDVFLATGATIARSHENRSMKKGVSLSTFLLAKDAKLSGAAEEFCTYFGNQVTYSDRRHIFPALHAIAPILLARKDKENTSKHLIAFCLRATEQLSYYAPLADYQSHVWEFVYYLYKQLGEPIEMYPYLVAHPMFKSIIEKRSTELDFFSYCDKAWRQIEIDYQEHLFFADGLESLTPFVSESCRLYPFKLFWGEAQRYSLDNRQDMDNKVSPTDDYHTMLSIYVNELLKATVTVEKLESLAPLYPYMLDKKLETLAPFSSMLVKLFLGEVDELTNEEVAEFSRMAGEGTTIESLKPSQLIVTGLFSQNTERLGLFLFRTTNTPLKKMLTLLMKRKQNYTKKLVDCRQQVIKQVEKAKAAQQKKISEVYCEKEVANV